MIISEKYRSLLHLEKIPGWKTKFEDFGNNFQNLYSVFDENKKQKYFFGRVRMNIEGKILKFIIIVEQEKPYEIKLHIKRVRQKKVEDGMRLVRLIPHCKKSKCVNQKIK